MSQCRNSYSPTTLPFPINLLEMMKLQFWRPTLNNRLGHVALKTDRYYVSFRPTKGSLPGGGSSRIKNGIPVSQIMEGMKGCLVLHQSVDRNCESGCDPIEYEIILETAAASSNDEHVNSVVEEFLRYNGIDPEDVTIERCEELYKKRREYKLLPPEEARNVEEPEKPIKLLPKTEYSYDSVEFMSGKTETDAEPFYHQHQSCVSLLFNIIQTAWLRRHPDHHQPSSSPMSNPVELITDLPFQMFYKVPWLEQVVRKHLTSRIVNTSNNEWTEWVDTVMGTMSNTEMPTVYIWYPDKNNRFGHAALQTDKYHISFWSADAVDDKKRTVTQGIPGSLVFHQKLDMEYEGNRLPTATYQIDTVTNEAINRIHQEFLRYNDIDPADVTMEAAEKLLKTQPAEVSVGRTPYTFVVDIRGQVTLCDVLLAVIHWYTSTLAGGNLLPTNLAITGKPPWYHSKQSCLSLCYHMILNADAESQGIARLYHFVTLQALDNFTVPWFESHVKKYWIRNSLLHTFNIGDNSVTRSARYWLWDKWTSSSSSHQTQEIGTFRQFLSRGLKIFRKMKRNRLISFLCLSGLVAFFHLIEEHYYPIGTSMIFNIFLTFLPFFFLYFPAN